MFYVGVFAHYEGANKAHLVKVKILEKLGHSIGRGERFLKEHPVKVEGEHKYRALIFQLPPRFILSNDVIRHTMKVYKCDWPTAKFHCYRLSATNVLGKQDVWEDVLNAEKEAEAAKQSTATDPEPRLLGNEPVVNPEIDTIKP